MSVVRTRHGQVEVRSYGTVGLTVPSRGGWGRSTSGVVVNTDSAVGLPALGRAIRLVGGLIGSAAIGIFEGKRGDKRELQDSSQAALFDNPYPGMSLYDWRYDIAVSLEASENAFLRKIKTSRGKVVALEPIPHRLVNARIDRNGDKIFEISTAQGWRQAARGEILHIRGQTVEGGPFGVSRITQHCDPLGAILAAQQFEGSYFRNYARPDFVMEFPQGISQEQAQQWKDVWDAKMAGPGNQGQARAIGGGATVKPIPMSLKDAQFIESKGMNVTEVSQIMDVEELLIGGGQQEQNDDQAMDRFLAFQLPPRLVRIVAAFKADEDLFPNGDPSYPEFISNPLMFASPQTRAEVQHKEIQAGTLLPDEARADNGRPPLPDGLGQIPQVTPVGGAPNPALEPTPAPEPARSLELREASLAVPVQPDFRAIIEESLTRYLANIEPRSINVYVPERSVEVHPQAIEVDARSTVHVPDPAPITVHNQMPELPAPVVTVEGTTVVVEEREQLAPVVNLSVEPTPITIEAPLPTPVHVDARQAAPNAPVVNVKVNPTPVVVEAPVTVNVPEAAPPIVMVENTIESPNKRVTVQRDSHGLIKEAKIEDEG